MLLSRLRRRALRLGIPREHFQVLIVSLTICCGHVSYVQADDPEQSFRFRPVPRREPGEPDRRIWQIHLDVKLVLERDGMVANYMELAGLNGSGLYAHALLAKIKRESVNFARTMPLVALIDYRHPQRDWFGRRRNLPLTVTLLKLVGILNGTNELQSVEAAEAVLVGEKSAAGWAFFHIILLQRTARLYSCAPSIVSSELS